MANKARESLEKKAQKAMLQHAFFRWESAAVIALTLLLAAFGPDVVSFVPGWAWLIAGSAAEAALVYSSFSDPETGRRVVADMLRSEFEPQRLRDRRLQEQVAQALDYRSRITAAIRDRRDTVLRNNLSETAGQIDEWLENIYTLASRLDRYQREKEVLERDKGRGAERIRQLEQRLAVESDPIVRDEIAGNIEAMKRQIATIASLENTMQRAELRLENTLAALGTIYSQTMLVGAKDIDSGRAKRLREDISDEVQELDHILLAMDEVYAGSSTS